MDQRQRDDSKCATLRRKQEILKHCVQPGFLGYNLQNTDDKGKGGDLKEDGSQRE